MYIYITYICIYSTTLHRASSSEEAEDDDTSRDPYSVLDGNYDTFWNSGIIPDMCLSKTENLDIYTHYIIINFIKPVNIYHLTLNFQGGFTCKYIRLLYNEVKDNNDGENINWKNAGEYHIEDTNREQYITLNDIKYTIYSLKIEFCQLLEMFGRIILYSIEPFGTLL